MYLNRFFLFVCISVILVLTACGMTNSKSNAPTGFQEGRLSGILIAQPAEHQARYRFRHPLETLAFFDVAPGETVLEVLPGGGWYSQLLGPYLGEQGTLIGVDYDMALFPNFSWVTDAFMEKRANWGRDWQQKVLGWGDGIGAAAQAYNFNTLPSSLDGTVDTVLFIRALHNLARFEDKDAYLTKALKASHRLLKPGGMIGVVQHEARADKSNAWADGSTGYIKKSFVIEKMAEQGFRLVGERAFNENLLDQPGDKDIVWRLPPVMNTSGDNEALKRRYQAIGESHRMTLLFKKR